MTDTIRGSFVACDDGDAGLEHLEETDRMADPNYYPPIEGDTPFPRWFVDYQTRAGLDASQATSAYYVGVSAWRAALASVNAARGTAEREARKDEAREPIDTEYAWLVDGEWQGSSTSARECLRYIEQYRVDGEIEVTRIETYQCSEAELHAAALQAEHGAAARDGEAR